MKKTILSILLIMLVVTMVSFGVSCKGTTAETTAAATAAEETTAAATAAEETTAAATTAEETTAVAGPKETTEHPFFIYQLALSVGSDYMVECADTWTKACEEKGYKLQLFDVKDFSLELAITQFDEMIAMKPDVIVCQEMDPKAEGPSFQKAQDQGIPVIVWAGVPDRSIWPSVTCVASASFVGQGKTAAELLIEGMKKKFGENLAGRKVVVLQGKMGTGTAQQREEGIIATLHDQAPELEIIDEQSAEFNQVKGAEVMEAWLAKFDQIDGVISHDDTCLSVAAQTAEDAGRAADTVFVGIGGTKNLSYPLVKSGLLYGLAAQPASTLTLKGLEMAERVYAGEEVPFINNITNEKVTADNVDSYLE